MILRKELVKFSYGDSLNFINRVIITGERINFWEVSNLDLSWSKEVRVVKIAVNYLLKRPYLEGTSK